jgi:hypothetical protein
MVFIYFLVLGIELRAFQMLGMCSTTHELHPSP